MYRLTLPDTNSKIAGQFDAEMNEGDGDHDGSGGPQHDDPQEEGV